MTVINTGLLEKGLKSEFSQTLRGTVTNFAELSTRVPSNSDHETYKWLGSTPKMREWGTGRVAKGLRTESYSVVNEKYEATIEVDRDEIDDDQTGQIRIRVGEMAQHAATHKDYLLSELLKNGATAGFVAYDGKVFFAADHESGASGVQSNLVAASAVDPSNPTTDEFKAALKASITRVLAFKNDVGEPMAMGAGGMVCVVPPSMMYAAMEAVNASIISNTSNVMQGAARVVTFPWLTDTDRWYLLKTDGIIRPFIFQDRAPIEFTAKAEGSDEAFNREKYLYGVRARYAMTYAMWQFATRVLFS